MVDRGRMRTALEKRELNVTHDSGLDLGPIEDIRIIVM